MYDRIAVIYRGHLRTWNYVKEVNFQFFESISKNVDYYFVTWDIGKDFSAIENDFKDRNLIKFLLVKRDDKYYQSDFGPVYHLSKILPYKKEREQTVKYDAVIDTRPDVILKKISDFPVLEDMTLYVEWMNDNIPNTINGIGDLCNIMSSEVFDIISQRYKQAENRLPQVHVNFKDYCIEHNIKIEKFITFCGLYFIRPQILDIIKNPFDLLSLDIRTVFKYVIEWNTLSEDKRFDVLNRHNICLEDYRGWVNKN